MGCLLGLAPFSGFYLKPDSKGHFTLYTCCLKTVPDLYLGTCAAVPVLLYTSYKLKPLPGLHETGSSE
jgi:hypothetical protein